MPPTNLVHEPYLQNHPIKRKWATNRTCVDKNIFVADSSSSILKTCCLCHVTDNHSRRLCGELCPREKKLAKKALVTYAGL